MEKHIKLNLQLFAGEGSAGSAGSSGAGVGEGASSGDNGAIAPAADAGQTERLRELGVPESVLKKRASRAKSNGGTLQTAQSASDVPKTETAADSAPAKQDTPETEETQGAPAKFNWDEITKHPEFNKRIQTIVSSRLKSEKSAEEALGKMAPAIEVLARKYDLDAQNMDYETLAKKINDDDAYYEDKALEMGVSIDTAKKVDQMERDNERRKAMEQRTLQEQKIQNHFTKLEQQAEAMKKVFPSFDLRTELQNPYFARMTSPNVGISVEDAYYAIHRNEIQTASMQIAANKTAEKIASAIQSGSRRPNESGASSQAPSVTTFDYTKASREQREAFKKDLRAKMARGEKVYPGT